MFYSSSIAAAILIAVVAAARRNPDWLTDATIAVSFGAYPLFFGAAMAFCEGIRYRTADSLLYQIDRSVGLDSIGAIHFFQDEHRELYLSLMAAYMALPIVLAIAWALERSTTLLRAVSIAPAFALLLYNLVPGVGPIHAFTAQRALVPFDAVANLPRNAFPSMHLSWALLAAFNARSRTWRIVTSIFVALMCEATICSGEHYFVDLAAAIPFSIGVQYLAFRFSPRAEAALEAANG